MTSRLPAAVLAALALTVQVRADSETLVLGTSGAKFTVNGTARFLVFASYFDALDAVSLDADLDYLAGHVDGIRVFANWWNFADTPPCRLRFATNTLIGVDEKGSPIVRPRSLARLRTVLEAARARGLIVDLTFAAEPVEGLSRLSADARGAVCPGDRFRNVVRWREYAPAVASVAAALRGPMYRHVLFDLQNEAGHRLNGATPDDLRLLASAARAADPSRLLAISMFDPDAARQADLVDRLKLACLDFHDWPRGRGWGDRTAAQVRKFRRALDARGVGVPVYAGEPDADPYGGGTAEFEASLAGARGAGAAAWTFHNRAAHDLGGRSLDAALRGDGREFLDRLRRDPRTGRLMEDRTGALGVN